jgi:hypothetical protein
LPIRATGSPAGAAQKFVEKWSGVELSERAATGAGQLLPKDHRLGAERARVDQAVLKTLPRLNHLRR